MSRWMRRTRRRRSAITIATDHVPNVWDATNMPVVRGSVMMTNDQVTTGETSILEAEVVTTVGKAVVAATEGTIKVEATTTKVDTAALRAATNHTTNPLPTTLTDATAVAAADTGSNPRTVVTKVVGTETTTTNHTAPTTTTSHSGAAIMAANTPTNSNNSGDNGVVTIVTAIVITATATTTEVVVATVTRPHAPKSLEDLIVALLSGGLGFKDVSRRPPHF